MRKAIWKDGRKQVICTLGNRKRRAEVVNVSATGNHNLKWLRSMPWDKVGAVGERIICPQNNLWSNRSPETSFLSIPLDLVGLTKPLSCALCLRN